MLPMLPRLASDRKGSVSTMFAFSLLPMLIVAGAAVDYSGAITLRSTVQNATDSTILALCQQPTSTTTAQLQSQAQSWVAAEVKTKITVAPLVIANNPRQITMTSTATYPSAFGKIVGLSAIPVSAKAQCTAPAPKDFEIALVLDNTGSMAESSGSTSKIQALQQAATNFVNYVFTNSAFDAQSRVSIVPFASSVAVDPNAYRNATWIDQAGLSPYHWNNISNAVGSGFLNRLQIFDSMKAANASWGWAGCVESVAYPLNVNDGAPSLANPSSLYVPYLSPDEPSNTLYNYYGYNYPVYSPNMNGSVQVFGNADLAYNSYITDTGSSSKCSTPSNEQNAAMQACKYVKPVAAPSSAVTPFGPNFSCNGLPLIRLTNAQSTLINEINAMSPNGNTDIHEGVMWGWRTLSPISVFADGLPYSTKNLQKVIVLMTDGTNTWTSNSYNSMYKSLYSAYGYFRNADGSNPNARLPPGNANPSSDTQARAAIDELTLEACTNAKAAGISIYTIGFSIPSNPIDQQGLSLLQNCASGSNQFYVANDSSGLITAFNQIATSIGALRLSQ